MYGIGRHYNGSSDLEVKKHLQRIQQGDWKDIQAWEAGFRGGSVHRQESSA
jgi:hypothetical protein